MNGFEQAPLIGYDWLVVAYFFLGAMSVGAFLFSVYATYIKKYLQPIGRTAGLIAPFVLAFGMMFLILDLGQPFRFWRLFVTFSHTAMISWGVWFLNIFFLACAGNAWFLYKSKPNKAKYFAFFGSPFAVLVGTYTAMLLMQAPGKTLWHSPLLPVLFLNGALLTGIALTLLVSAGRQASSIVAKTGGILVCLLVVQLGLLGLEIYSLFIGGEKDVLAARELLAGRYSLPFLGMAVIAGCVVPLGVLIGKRSSPLAGRIASILAIVGILALRYVVIYGGQVLSI